LGGVSGGGGCCDDGSLRTPKSIDWGGMATTRWRERRRSLTRSWRCWSGYTNAVITSARRA
jgi:hypothetical protein